MELTVGPDLEPGPDALSPARVASLATSPAGVLDLLETVLGLRAPLPSQTERITALLPTLRTTSGYWSRSLTADEWGTARRLLRDLAALTLEGWAGQPISARWDALWQVTRGTGPTQGERWQAVATALTDRPNTSLQTLNLLDPLPTWPGSIRRAFERLSASGTTLRDWTPPELEPTGDLAAVHHDRFEPTGDASLQLIRAPGPLEGADDLAAWLRATAPGATTIIGADATLDEALRRHAMPGAATPAGADALALLPLSLALLHTVPDPSRVLEFLLVHPHPIPGGLRHRLARALRRTPAVGSDGWIAALDTWHQTAAPPKAELATTLLSPGTLHPCDPVPIADVQARVQPIAAWARAHAHAHAVTRQCATFLALLEHAEQPTAPRPWIERMLAAATQDAGTPRTTAQAGPSFVRRPGGMLLPADTVIWWNFTRDAARTPRPMDLTAAERQALATHGVEVRTPAARAIALARRWWQPLRLARTQVILVAPRTNSPGEVLHPHPLWSEVVAKIPREQRERTIPLLEARRRGPGPQQPTEALPAPTAAERWQVAAGSIARRDEESPSSMSSLVGCPFQWTLRYPARVSQAHEFALDLSPRDRGSLAHAVLQVALRDGAPTPEEAEQRAAEAFDRLGPLCAAALFQPGQATARDQTRAQICGSARALAQWLATQGLQIEALELESSRDAGEQRIKGRLDLVAASDTARVVIDHKLGGRTQKRAELQGGSAVQLATYAFTLQKPGELMPSIGYFIVLDQALLGIAGGPFSDAESVQGPPPQQIWDAFLEAAQHRWQQLAQGSIEVTGVGGHAGTKTRLDGDALTMAPPCKYCDYDLLCGKVMEGRR